MWKEVLNSLVNALKHLISTIVLVFNCCRNNNCTSECCVKREEFFSDNYNKEHGGTCERSDSETKKEN